MRDASTAIESALEQFREAAIAPSHWPGALDQLSTALESDGATLVLKRTSHSSIAVSTSIRPFINRYMAGEFPDPRERRVNPSVHQGFMPDYAYFSESEIDRNAYYQEFLRPNGFGWNATAALQGELMISVKRSFDRGPYLEPELQTLDRILPWLRSISRAARATWQTQATGELGAYERLGRGAILIDAKGRVLQTNQAVEFGDGLDVSQGRLTSPCAKNRETLRRFVASLLPEKSASFTTAPPSQLVLARRSGGRPYILDGISRTEGLRSLHSHCAALILVINLETHGMPPDGLLESLFCLTRTEAAVARELLRGQSVEAAAGNLSISVGHARQRLKSILQKTQTSRQGELIALLMKCR